MTYAEPIVANFILFIIVFPALLKLIPSEEHISVLNRKKKRIEQFFLFSFEVLDRLGANNSDRYALEHKFFKISGYKCNYEAIMKLIEHPQRYKLVRSYCLQYDAIDLVNDEPRISDKKYKQILRSSNTSWKCYLVSSVSILLTNSIPADTTIRLITYTINVKMALVIILSMIALISACVLVKLSRKAFYMTYLRNTFGQKRYSDLAYDSAVYYLQDFLSPYTPVALTVIALINHIKKSKLITAHEKTRSKSKTEEKDSNQ